MIWTAAQVLFVYCLFLKDPRMLSCQGSDKELPVVHTSHREPRHANHCICTLHITRIHMHRKCSVEINVPLVGFNAVSQAWQCVSAFKKMPTSFQSKQQVGRSLFKMDQTLATRKHLIPVKQVNFNFILNHFPYILYYHLSVFMSGLIASGVGGWDGLPGRPSICKL